LGDCHHGGCPARPDPGHCIFGTERFGATRTFRQGSIQPSEVAKLATIIYVATWLTSKGRRIRDARAGLLPFGVLMGFVSVLIVLQPEISTAILIVATAAIMLFIAGADLKQFIAVGIITTATFFLIIYYSDYASSRLDKYLASVGNPLASDEWQVTAGGAGVDARRRPGRASATGWRSKPAICRSVGATTSSA
jgi:cell division protein FtsW